MMRSIVWMGALLFATSASAALKAGDTVYVRARDTKVLKAPGSTAQVAQLQPGDSLTWKGQSKKDPHYHEVATENGKTGVVWYQNLSTTPPKGEVVVEGGGNGKKVSAQAFASYGAAARGLTPATKNVAQKKADVAEIAKKLEAAETIARSFDPKDGEK